MWNVYRARALYVLCTKRLPIVRLDFQYEKRERAYVSNKWKPEVPLRSFFFRRFTRPFFRNCNVKIGRRPPASKIAARAHPPLARWAGARSFSKISRARSALRFRSLYISGGDFFHNSKQKRTSFSLASVPAPLRLQIFKFSRVIFRQIAPSP